MAEARSPSPVRRRRARREALLALAMLAPALVLFTVFVFYPLAKTVHTGLYRTPPFPASPGAGSASTSTATS